MKTILCLPTGKDKGAYLISFKGVGSKRTIVMKKHRKGFYYPDYLN